MLDSRAMTAAETPSGTDILSGLIERVTFHNPDNGFCVLKVKAQGRRELVTVVGHAPRINPGEFIHATGEWANDRTHGLQLKASDIRVTPPTTVAGMEKYLASGLIRGVGAVYAKKLIKAFGPKVLEIIEAEPERLRQVEGIGAKRASAILKSWGDQKALRDIMLFLHDHGVGTARATRIYKTYGAEAVKKIGEDPYRLARDIHGIGFKSADAIAERLGVPRDAEIRARAGIAYALSQAVEDGNCGVPEDELMRRAAELLEIPETLIRAAADKELGSGLVVRDTLAGQPCLFLHGFHRAERQIADRLQRLLPGAPPWGAIDAGRAIPWVEAQTGLILAPSQKDAVRVALTSKVLVITGGPGVGKTTLVNSILKLLAAKDMRILLGAPTGRAAKRLSESTGREAKTLHRLLEADPSAGGFRRDESNPLEADLVVVDETSMVDVLLMQSLMKAVPRPAALLLVGDVDQLPSVGPGQVLGDIIDSGAVPVVRLTEVFRQAAESRIIANAHRINSGEMPQWASDPDSDFFFVPAETPEDARDKLLEIVCRRIPRRFGLDPLREVQVLTPMNRGGLGAQSLNLELQAALNPSPSAKIERFGTTYAIGDKVMQIENDYDKEVYNGDIGFVAAIDAEAEEILLTFDGRDVPYEFGELDRVQLAYAVTIHKSQGSEYPAVVVPLSTQHYPMLERNLIYTAITRGKRLVVVVGQTRALSIAVHNITKRPRWSKLKEWLAAPALPETLP